MESVPDETPIDPSDIKIKWITTRAELSSEEANNVLSAVKKYLGSKPSRSSAKFDLDWLLQLHEEMFGRVMISAGKVRDHDLSLGVNFYAILPELQALIGNLHSWPGFGMEMVEQAARLHYEAVRIHPFKNGNGRWSRLLANIWLRLNGQPTVNWPENMTGVESAVRVEYIAALKSADNGDIGPLIEMHRQFSSQSFAFATLMSRHADSDFAKLILSVPAIHKDEAIARDLISAIAHASTMSRLVDADSRAMILLVAQHLLDHARPAEFTHQNSAAREGISLIAHAANMARITPEARESILGVAQKLAAISPLPTKNREREQYSANCRAAQSEIRNLSHAAIMARIAGA